MLIQPRKVLIPKCHLRTRRILLPSIPPTYHLPTNQLDSPRPMCIAVLETTIDLSVV